MSDENVKHLSDLNHSGLLSINSKEDREVSFSVGVWQGNASISIFQPGGGQAWRLPMPDKFIAELLVLLEKMRNEPRPLRQPVMLNKYQEGENGQRGSWKEYGQLGVGIDENLTFYFDIAAQDLQSRFLFPIKPDGRFDFSHTTMTDKDHLVAMIDMVIRALRDSVNLAKRLSAFRRQGGGKGGFNKGGNRGGGNRSGGGGYGGGNNGGGGNRSGGSFGGGGGEDSDLHFG